MPTIAAAAPRSPRLTPIKKSDADAALASKRNYEVQRHANGRWLLDSVADEKEVAIAMAKSLLQSGKASQGVRVMAVQIKPGGEFSQITIFRRAPGEANVEPATPPKPAAKTAPQAETEKRDFKHVDPPKAPAPQTGGFGHIVLALKIAFLVGFAVVAFEAIHILSR